MYGYSYKCAAKRMGGLRSHGCRVVRVAGLRDACCTLQVRGEHTDRLLSQRVPEKSVRAAASCRLGSMPPTITAPFGFRPLQREHHARIPYAHSTRAAWLLQVQAASQVYLEMCDALGLLPRPLVLQRGSDEKALPHRHPYISYQRARALPTGFHTLARELRCAERGMRRLRVRDGGRSTSATTA